MRKIYLPFSPAGKAMKKYCLSVVLLFFFTLASFAQTTTWTGANGTNWNDSGNWSNGFPAAGYYAIIPTNSGSGNFPVMEGFVYANYNITSYGQLTNNAYLLSTQNIILSAVGEFYNNGVLASYGSIDNKTDFHNTGLVISGVSFMNNGTIENSNTIYNDGFFNNNGTVENYGTFSNRQNGSINNSIDFVNYASFYNNGSYNGNAGCNFDNIGGAFYSDGTFGNNGFMYNSGTLTCNGFFLNNVAGEITSIATLNNLGDFDNSGTIINSGWMVNNDQMTNNFTGSISNSGTLQNNGCSIYSHFSSQALSSTVGNLGVMYEIGSSVNVSWGNGIVLYNTGSLPAPDAVCMDATVSVDPLGGSVTITPNMVNGGSSASYCYIASMQVSPNTFTCADTGFQTVVLTVTDGLGFTSSCFASVEVSCTDGAGGGGQSRSANIENVLELNELEAVRLFPNPSIGGSLNLQWENNLTTEQLDIQVVNVLGKVVFQKHFAQFNGTSIFLQPADLAIGTYLVRMQAGEDFVVKKWIVK